LVENTLTVERKNENARNFHGLTRTLIDNLVTGVTQGFEKKLEIGGVGYKVDKQGENLVLTVGYSHTVTVNALTRNKI